MADYLFNYAAGELEYGTAPLSDQARALLRAKIWGLPEKTPKYGRQIRPGDRVIVYAGGSERVCVGDAVLATAYHPFAAEEIAAHPGNLTSGVTFSAARVWGEPVPLTWTELPGPREQLRGSILPLVAGDFERLVPTGRSRPFDPTRRPSEYGDISPYDPEAAAALAEQATQDHFELMVALHARLRAEGWTELLEIPGAIDLWARDPAGQRHIFEVKTLGNELKATRGAIAQLLEYRVVHGSPDDRVCLVIGAPLNERRVRVLRALEIDVLVL